MKWNLFLRSFSVLALLFLSVAALAADTKPFAITKANWKSGDKLLKILGTGPRGATVAIKNAGTGAVLGSATIKDDSTWKFEKKRPPVVPCRVRAEIPGNSLERAVQNAPANCGGQSPTLASLSISGPTTVNENASASYAATATFSDGSTQNVTAAASWSENSAYASISAGVLTASEVPSDQAVTVSASYAAGGVTRSATQSVTIVNALLVLSSLSISGPATVNENASASYAATATFSDGSTQNVTAAAGWSENSAYASISAGVLTASEVPSDQAVTVSASYAAGGVTRSATQSVTIINVPVLTGSHVGRFSSFEGTATCLTCHTEEATAMHASAHYQWQGDASESQGLDSAIAGKLGGINDFCIYPDINWIGKLTTVDGRVVDGGCAKCHTGLGAKPSPVVSQAQLENIDCLLCHSKTYKRTVAMVNGSYRFVPDTANMTVSLLQSAVDITLPDKNTCLNCHTRAGGGDNFKRGDIEEAHRNATADFDIHLAPTSAGGAGLECTSCHISAGHRIAGRGIDLRERDTPTIVACANCHGSQPHTSADLNKHTARLNCNVCHIPSYAKVAPTDMVRDWSAPGDLNPATQLYEPHMTMASHVTPVYGFFNGQSKFYQFGSPAVPQANGRILMAGPLGSVTEPGSKIQAMKAHRGVQPIDPATGRLFPLKIGIFFQTGDVATSVAQGAAGVGWPYSGHEFAETERFMGLFHEVAPHDQALQCASCHDGNRMDFAALGYTPKETRNGKPLCASCHSAKTASFYTLHNKHVGDKNINCIECHTFSKAT